MAVAKKPEPGTLGWRITEAREIRGYSQNEVGKRAGLEDGHISKVVHGKGRVTTDVQEKIALALGVSFIWLSTGQGEMERPDGQVTPAPPATRTRERTPISHAFSDEIEDLAADVLRQQGAPRYRGRHVTATKVFFADAKPKMDLSDRHALFASALDAAYSLDEDDIEPTPSAILARLLERAAPAYSRQEQASVDRFDERMAEAEAQLAAEDEPPLPPAAPSTTRKKAGRR